VISCDAGRIVQRSRGGALATILRSDYAALGSGVEPWRSFSDDIVHHTGVYSFMLKAQLEPNKKTLNPQLRTLRNKITPHILFAYDAA
jgi:hypothetical protein